VEEVENLLTDVLFIDKGRIVLDSSLDEIATRYAAVEVAADRVAEARAEKPFYERRLLGKVVLYFERPDLDRLALLGECTRRASRICSSRSCPGVPNEQLCLAGTAGVLGKRAIWMIPAAVGGFFDPLRPVRPWST